MDDLFFQEENQEEESIDIQKYLKVVLKRKWLILSIFIVVTVPWMIYLKGLPPTYEAFCDIEFRSLESSDENVINESRIIKLRSRTFAERVVGQLGLTLNMNPKEMGITRHHLFDQFSTTQDPNVGTYIFRWDNGGKYTIHRIDATTKSEKLVQEGSIAEAQSQIQNENKDFQFKLTENLAEIPHEIKFEITRFKNAVDEFRKITDVSFAGPNILRLKMINSDPVLVAKMVNQLARIYVDESKSLKQKTLEEQRKIIEDKLSIAEQNLLESENKLREFKSTKIVSLDAETSKRSSDLNSYESNLQTVEKNLGNLEMLLQKIDPTNDSKDEKERIKYVYQQLTQLPIFASNYKMGALQSQLNDLEKSYSEFTKGSMTERHPRAIELDNEITDVHNKIKNEALAHRKDTEQELAQLRQKISSLQYNLKEKLPADQMQLMVLEREYRSNEEIYRQLKSQSQNAAISDAVETESVDILDPAIEPELPVNRTKKQKAIMGAAFAMFLGFGVAFMLEFMDKSIKTVDDVRKYLKLNVLGTIPNLEFKDIGEHQDSEKIKMIDQQLVTYDYSPTPIGEAYRSLRTNLVFSKTTGRIQTFVITSTAPGDGKSFTAANLAISIAQHKRSTLVIDADLRRGVLHNTFGVSKEPGFTNYLTGTASFAQIVNETLIPNLFLVSCGSLLPNPSELLGSHQMKRFLDEAKRKYDILLFDSPPLNAATDAIVIGTQVDTTVVVIRAGVTNRNLARQKLDLYKNVPAKVMGVILNGTVADFGHDGYSYYHY
jgi:polysaccharide biosynthesis transport protein